MFEKFELRQDIVFDDVSGFGTQLGKVTEDALYLPCECRGEVIGFSKFSDEEEIHINFFKYDGCPSSFSARIKTAWKILTGQKVNTADVVISKENAEKIKQWLTKE